VCGEKHGKVIVPASAGCVVKIAQVKSRSQRRESRQHRETPVLKKTETVWGFMVRDF
jgi:hypothetical protein